MKNLLKEVTATDQTHFAQLVIDKKMMQTEDIFFFFRQKLADWVL